MSRIAKLRGVSVSTLCKLNRIKPTDVYKRQAGHDLSLVNLNYFYKNIPWVDEVSIGHALISDALYLGLERTIQEYKNCLR